MINNYPSGNTTTFVGKINELEKMIISNQDIPLKGATTVFQKKKAIKKIKTVFRQLDQDINASVGSK
ncbi:hypothetical protein BKI52_05310 [marine bacterium AO1-C]|nr:hypothetical protein BKI52_05310 [marine bacterium AO1-C]